MQIFLSNCAGCHGPDGDLIPNINLASGKFRHAQGDNDLRRIVQKGIPGTPMPPGNYTDEQAGVIVAYLRSLSGTSAKRMDLPAEGTRGKAIVEGKGECLSCHRIGAKGSVTGPDLTGIGAARRSSDLEKALTDPDAEIRPDNLTVRAVDKNGTQLSGRLMNMDTYTIQILEYSTARLRTLRKETLREYEVMKSSPMPNYRQKLNAQEIADIVAYLVSLKESP